MSLRHLTLSTLLLVSSAIFVAADTVLVMVEEQGCVWCERWNDEIAHIYPKTVEGKAAPLRRIDLHAPLPDDLTFSRSLHFTPTFVLMIDGQEANRIEGYPGEDFFWGLLSQMLTASGVEVAG
ncbi:MAG: hypothetical protein ACI84R_002762 [Candidatus Azotimanducaceae bacterium]|jgi:hypothetical protein